MAKKKTELPETGIDNLNDNLTRLTEKVQKNNKVITYVSLAIAVVVAIVIGWYYFIHQPNQAKATDAIGVADLSLAQGEDSLALTQYQKVAAEYGGDAANRANLQAAIQLYKEGKYEEALKYLKDYDAKEEIIGAGAYSLTGDCYVNLKKYDDAVKAYNKAVSQSNKNPQLTPFVMLKLARVYAAQGNHAKEAETYKAVLTEYPMYGESNQIDVQKYYDRAVKLQEAGK